MNEAVNLIFIFGAKYLYFAIIIISGIWFLGQPNAKKKEILIIFCICLPLVFIVSEIAGSLYYKARPFVVGNFKPLISHQADNGFPSHHALLACAISTVIFIFNKRAGLLLWVLALFVGFSRVYAGLHHWVDILGSILISVISVAAVYFIVKLFKKDRK